MIKCIAKSIGKLCFQVVFIAIDILLDFSENKVAEEDIGLILENIRTNRFICVKATITLSYWNIIFGNFT